MMMSQQAQQELVKQTGQLAGTPLMDPTKNPELSDQATALASNMLGAATQPMEEPQQE